MADIDPLGETEDEETTTPDMPLESEHEAASDSELAAIKAAHAQACEERDDAKASLNVMTAERDRLQAHLNDLIDDDEIAAEDNKPKRGPNAPRRVISDVSTVVAGSVMHFTAGQRVTDPYHLSLLRQIGAQTARA